MFVADCICDALLYLQQQTALASQIMILLSLFFMGFVDNKKNNQAYPFKTI